MKKSYTFLSLLLLCAISVFGQAPEKFTYQSVVRNASNTLVANSPVGVRVSILQGSASGNAVYMELHTATTNANGLLTLEIGGGTAQQGTFADIAWANGPFFLKTETDPNGGTNYSITSTQQMLSVPYALYAKNAGNIPTIPANVSAFANDAGYITMDSVPSVPTNVSAFFNDANYLTNYTETDPQFNAWDKDYNDLVNTPTIPTVPTNISAFINDSGYITGYTETDPNVPAWAKEATKPAYNYSEIANTPTIPTVPTNVSAFNNDAGYITMDSIPEIPTVPTNVSAFANDAGYITMDSIPAIPTVPTTVSTFTNDAGYITSYDETQTLADVTAQGNSAGSRQLKDVSDPTESFDAVNLRTLSLMMDSLRTEFQQMLQQQQENMQHQIDSLKDVIDSFHPNVPPVACPSVKIQPVIFGEQQEPLCPNYGNLTIVAVDSLTGNQIPNLSYTWSGESVNILSTNDTSFIIIMPDWCNHQYEVYLSVTDTLNGCTASTTYTLDVRDTIPPVVQDGVLENQTVLPTSEGKYYIPDFTSLLTHETVSDNCYPFSTLTINQNPAAGTEFSETTTVTITLSGPCGDENQYFVQVDPSIIVGDGQPCIGTPTVTDYDGNTYNTVHIGNQCWMKENLRTTHYADGTAIPDGGSYTNDTLPYYYDYSSSAIPLTQRGYLYNWPAVMRGALSSNTNPSGVQGICPAGWHVPSDAEWTQLTDYVSSQSEYLCSSNTVFIAKVLASTTGWSLSSYLCAVGNEQNLNNSTGFCAIPAGYKYNLDLTNSSKYAYFWSSTEASTGNAWYRSLNYNYSYVYRNNYNKYFGYSVRCLRDTTGGSYDSTQISLPTVTTDSVTAITTTSATLNGTIFNPDNVTITAQGFEWKTAEDSNYTTVNASGETMSYNLTGLTANTGYSYRAFVTTAEGTNYGEEVSFTTTAAASQGGQPCSGTPTVVDYDDNVYNTVQIGQQCWMKENLRTTREPDGTIISGRYYPNNDSNNVAVYGYLYHWFAVMNGASSNSANPSGVQGICPTGWHVPSDAEWTELETYLSSQNQYFCNNDSSYIAKALASTTGWNSPEGTSCLCCVGSNQSTNNATGFDALPSGHYYFDSSISFGDNAYFWSSTEISNGSARYCGLTYSVAHLYRYTSDKSNGHSVRCLRN